MSLASAITALSPWFYWKLDEGVGAGSVADYGGGAVPGTVTGDVGFGAHGPEEGTTAARLFSTGKIVSPALHLTAFQNFSFFAVVTAPATVTSPTNAWWATIGDATNALTRGFAMGQSSTSINTLSNLGRIFGVSTSAPFPFPQNLWHMVGFTFDVSTNTRTPYIDSLPGTTSSTSPAATWLTGDPLTITSPWPIVVSHVAAFSRVLTQLELKTVSDQIPVWPFQLPINVPYTTGAPAVDLTPVLNNQAIYMPKIQTIEDNQSTYMPQIANVNTRVPIIETDTQNMVNTLFPQLSDFLNVIMDGLTTTITGIGGAVTKTLGELFSGKTWDLLGLYDFGTVCFPDVKTQDLGGGTFFGLQLEIQSYADWYVWTSPSDDYSTQSLGTLEIFRGGSLILRIGLHNKTHTVYPLPGVPLFEMVTEMPTIPGDYQFVLTPAPETCWAVQALQFP